MSTSLTEGDIKLFQPTNNIDWADIRFNEPTSTGITTPAVIVNSFIGNGVDGGVNLGTIPTPVYVGATMTVKVSPTMSSIALFAMGNGSPSNDYRHCSLYRSGGKFRVFTYNTSETHAWETSYPVVVGETYDVTFTFSVSGGFTLYIDGAPQTLVIVYTSSASTNAPSTVDIVVGSNSDSQQYTDDEIYELYWSTNPLAVNEATIKQYATGQEHFTQVAPDVVPIKTESTELIIGGKEYPTALIGDLEWMSESLAHYSGSYMYPDNDINNVDEYGLLYYYPTAVSHTPVGWRIPTEADFLDLIARTNESNTNAGKYLKDGVEYWLSSSGIINNDMGFSARGSGIVWGMDPSSGYIPSVPFKSRAVFFTSTPSGGEGWYWCFNINDNGSINFSSEWVTINNSNRRNFSVRYVKDNPNIDAGWVGGAVQGTIEISPAIDTLLTTPSTALILDNGLENYILISLQTNRRAEQSDKLPSEGSERAGWWGDVFEDVNIGSKLWLRQRSRLSPNIFTVIQKDIEEALQWMIDDGIVDKFIVTVERDTREGVPKNNVKITVVAVQLNEGRSGFGYFFNWNNQILERSA